MSQTGAMCSISYQFTKEHTPDYLLIPRALSAYNSRMLYNSYLVLETQLSQIDPSECPEMYKKLDVLTERLFNSWVTLGYRDGSAIRNGSGF